MSAGRSKATEDVLGARSVHSCEGSQLVSDIQQREALFTDRDALWEAIKSELFSCVWLPGVLSGPRQQTETGSRGQVKQVHRLRLEERSLPADWSRDKTSCASKKRDILGDHNSRWLHGWHWALTNPGAINWVVHWYWATKYDENQQSTTRTNWGWYCRFSGGYWGKSGRGGSSRFTFYRSSSVEVRNDKGPTISIRTGLYPCCSNWNSRAKWLLRSSVSTRKGSVAGSYSFRGEVSRSHGNMDTCW